MTRFLENHWVALCLSSIIILGLFLRVFHLGTQDYFSEEIFTVNGNELPLFQMLADLITLPQSGEPPLYFFIDKICVDLMGGITLESIRLPSAIFGTLCIPAIYALGKEYRDEITGLLSALIIAVSDRMIFYSQYARPYTLIFLLFIIAAFCFVKIRRDQPFRPWMTAFAVVSGLCLLTHYYSIIPLTVLWSILIWQHRKEIIPYLLIAAIPAGLFIVYIKIVIEVYLKNALSALYPYSVFNVTWVDNLFRVPYECWGYLGAILIPFFLLYLWQRRDPIACYFSLAAGITYLSTLLLTFVFNPSARYAVLIAPLIIVPAMVPVSELVRSGESALRKIVIVTGIVYVIIAVNIFPLISWYTTAYHFIFI